jgi:hypothetical protein
LTSTLAPSRSTGPSGATADTKTPKSGRFLSLPRVAVRALREHLGGQAEDRLLAGALWHDHGSVFASAIGTPLGYDIPVIAELCDRVAIMRSGQVVEQGPTGQVIAAPRHDYTRELLTAVPRLAESGLGD